MQVLFGTADGQVIVMDCHGRMLAHVLLHEADGILSMSWNYPAFLVEDSSESDTDSDDYSPPQGSSLLRGARRCPGREPSGAGGAEVLPGPAPFLGRGLTSVRGSTVSSLLSLLSLHWSGRGSVICLGFPRYNTRLRTLSVALGRGRIKGAGEEKRCAVPARQWTMSTSLTL